ncbi:ABC transporter permease [Roseococcus pinisoli]|uniref:ABC transporter permease n=1 Tax=Roseococcus pinisoli TaxID=2835040 RepID=A0ABS5QI67_9PROT|nr:ABC transporter permease [Roseococcus pinisoli]MBS7813389.1 ABC transporter permease [Roseococcus pinisoli]
MKTIIKQFRVLRALIVRELMMRYGREGGGFAWVVIEPMLLCVGVTTVWMLLKPGYERGVVVAALVFTGYMPLTLWRHLTNPAVHMLRRNRHLFYHRSISTLDLFWSRQILEFTATTAAFLIVYVALRGLGLVEPIYNWSLCLMAWLIMAYIAGAASLIMAVVTENFEWSERIVQPFQYLVVPLSGVFFVVDWLPQGAQNIIWFNPLIHSYEMMRAGFIGPGLTTHWTWWYPILFSSILVFFGTAGITRARKRLIF